MIMDIMKAILPLYLAIQLCHGEEMSILLPGNQENNSIGGGRGPQPQPLRSEMHEDWHRHSALPSDRSQHRYQHVAKHMNDVFKSESQHREEGQQERRNLRSAGADQGIRGLLVADLEESFENAQDVEDIFEDVFEHDAFTSEDEGQPDGSVPQYHEGYGDYYADLPDFVTHDGDDDQSRNNGDVDSTKPSPRPRQQQCKCVDCEQDPVCGGIWKRDRFRVDHHAEAGADDIDIDIDDISIMSTDQLKIHIVVSHCMSPLSWLLAFLEPHANQIASLHVITKCGQSQQARDTAPEYATVEEYENVGRCDHTYAYYITSVLPARVAAGEERESIAVFLKDDMSATNFHQSGRWNTFRGLVDAAASDHGFGCGIVPGGVDFGADSFDLSAYHESRTLHEFSMDAYDRDKGGKYKVDAGEFVSNYGSLGEWWRAVGGPEVPEAVQVCYGGVFSGSFANIYKSADVRRVREQMMMEDAAIASTWKNIERSLSRGNNIQEGHYAERSWAPLIQTQLPQYQLEALLEKADGVYMNKNSFHGALLRRPMLFVHVGAELGGTKEGVSTSSTEVLGRSVVEKIGLLGLDGYKVAVYGRDEDGKHGFPNIDHLGPCMLSDMAKSLIPVHLQDTTTCNENTLQDLSGYMKQTFKESQDMIMLNPTLLRAGTAEALSIYLDPVWDVKVVIYYRRFYEWIGFKYDKWREELMANNSYDHPNDDAFPSNYRYIDFLREHCKQLFYGKDVNEDGFPVRKLHQDVKSHVSEKNKTYLSVFDPTTNFDIKELSGFQDYVYFVAKQYNSQPRFRRGTKIVNSHDEQHGVETNFYCHVLHDASNACNDAVHREIRAQGQHLRSVSLNGHSLNDAKQALEDIAIEAYLAGRLSFDAPQSRMEFMNQISLWTEMIAQALHEANMFTEDLPAECLYQYERSRLLEASLAYEKSLLPVFYASSQGAARLERDFREQSFCSVDTDAILSDPQWDFLFKNGSDFIVLRQRRAFIHIGAPQTGGQILKHSLAIDKNVLKEDGLWFFSEEGDLAPCLWSDAQRQIIETGGKDNDDSACPEIFMSRFNRLLSDATAADNDVVISSEGLSMPSSETGLLDVLGDFDPTVVVYYRRFYEWILSSYYQWHLDIEPSSLQSMEGNGRLVDFVRLLVGPLFASETCHAGESLLDLPNTPEYTYHVWKQYVGNPAYNENIKVVDFHDHRIVESFYCDVLNAEEACKLESERLQNSEYTKSWTDPIVSKYVEIAVGLHSSNGLTSREQIYELAEYYEEKIAQHGLSEDDLPKECLGQAEMGMLLMISLKYEEILFPGYHSLGREGDMREHFGKLMESDAFCSVKLDRLTDSRKWQFLFESTEFVEALAM